jgi:hypothetical protein
MLALRMKRFPQPGWTHRSQILQRGDDSGAAADYLVVSFVFLLSSAAFLEAHSLEQEAGTESSNVLSHISTEVFCAAALSPQLAF